MRVILAAFLFLLVSCSGDPRTPHKRIREDVGSSVVRIFGTSESTRTTGGTGFSVKSDSGRAYILTNKHICSLANEKGELRVEFPGLTRKYSRKIIEVSEKHDLCLVESLPTFKNSLKVSNGVAKGETVFVVGHPKLFGLTVKEGEYIEEAQISVAVSKGSLVPIVINHPNNVTGAWQFPKIVTFITSRFNVYSRGGNSGSPIVNLNGDLVSVLFAGNPSDVMETYGVPLNFVKEFLKGY